MEMDLVIQRMDKEKGGLGFGGMDERKTAMSTDEALGREREGDVFNSYIYVYLFIFYFLQCSNHFVFSDRKKGNYLRLVHCMIGFGV